MMSVQCDSNENVEPFAAEGALQGSLVYLANPVLQFSAFTARAHQLNEEGGLYASASFMEAKGINEGDNVRVKTPRGEVILKAVVDTKIKGDISYLPTFDPKINAQSLFSGYRFSNVTIEKV